MNMTTFTVKGPDGQVVQVQVRKIGEAKAAARSAGPGAAVEAIDVQTGVSWTVGRWFTVRGKLAWYQTGPTS